MYEALIVYENHKRKFNLKITSEEVDQLFRNFDFNTENGITFFTVDGNCVVVNPSKITCMEFTNLNS